MPSPRLLTALGRSLRSYAARVTERADADARAAGLTIEVLAGGVRRYRDPRLDQLAARRASQPPVTPPAAAGTEWSQPHAGALVDRWGEPVCGASCRAHAPDLPSLNAGPAAPARSKTDRLRRADELQGPGRYQTRSPTSSRSAQDRSQTAPLRRAAPGTILRSLLDMGHPAGPVPGALRAGGEEHAPARPGSGPAQPGSTP
jgi:hypothetical protein